MEPKEKKHIILEKPLPEILDDIETSIVTAEKAAAEARQAAAEARKAGEQAAAEVMKKDQETLPQDDTGHHRRTRERLKDRLQAYWPKNLIFRVVQHPEGYCHFDGSSLNGIKK